MATREQVETAAVAVLGAEQVDAYTLGQVNAEGFTLPATYAVVRVSTTSRGLAKGSATSGVTGWRVEVDIVGTEAVNVNRYLDRAQSALYGHRFVIGSATSTPAQEGVTEPAELTADKRFAAFGDWTFAL